MWVLSIEVMVVISLWSYTSFSSVSSVPTEIITMITSFSRMEKSRQTVFTLMLINCHWHDSISGTPTLFNRVTVKTRKPLETLSYLLSLSKHLPLHVILAVSNNTSFSKLQEVSRLIAQHSFHIFHLHAQHLDWRKVPPAMQPLTCVRWPIIQQVEVMGFGLVDHTNHMYFRQWDIDVFFDWILIPRKGVDRVLVRRGLANVRIDERGASERVDFTAIDQVAPEDTMIWDTWDDFTCGRSLETLHLSSFLNAPLVPILQKLSTCSLSTLTTLHIHSRCCSYISSPISTWVDLAAKCPLITNLTLPYADQDIVELLSTSVWNVLTLLTFIGGPRSRSLPQLSDMVSSQSKSGRPLQTLELHDWESLWEKEHVAELRRLVDVSFVTMDSQ